MAVFVRPLTEEERQALERFCRQRTGMAGLARRAALILRSAQGEKAPAIARGLRVSDVTVRKWLRRFTAGGVAGLQERPRSGRPPRYSEVERGRVIQTVLTAPKKLGKPFCHWTLDLLAEHLRQEGVGMDRSHVHRVLRAEGVKWQKEWTWFASPAPEFAVKRGRSSPSIAIPRPVAG